MPKPPPKPKLPPGIREHHGKYQVRYRDRSGRERAESFRLITEAKDFRAAVRTDLRRRDWRDPRLGREPFGHFAERWLGSTVHLKPKTRAGYESLLRTHVLPAFGTLPIGSLEAVDLREWVARLTRSGLSTSRVRQAHQLTSAILEAAVDSGHIPRNPASRTPLPRSARREMLFLSAGELARLVQATPDPYGVLVNLLGYAGLRWGEAAALRVRRCDLLRSRIEVAESLSEVGGWLYFGETKTYQRRSVALPRFLRDQLAEHLAGQESRKPDALVFTSPEGGPLRNSNFRRRTWIPALKEAGLPEGLRIHDLRHTTVALLIAEGTHPKAIQTHLGHSSIQVTMDRYGHLFPDEMDRVAGGLDAIFRRSAETNADQMRTNGGPAVISMRERAGN